ncbi:unnamed protein product [Chrysoparadoxa australica]
MKRKAAGEAGEEDGAQGPGNKKRALRKERQSHRPEFDTVERAKQIWNKLRERKVPREERESLVQELLGLLKGKVYKVSMKHDASRVVQSAIQFSSAEERVELFEELKGHIVELSQLQYSHFIVLKLLTYAKGTDNKRLLVKEFKGNVMRLATHAIGSRVIQQALDTLPSSLTAVLKAEFYGKEFGLFEEADIPHSLHGVLELRPDRKDKIMGHLKDVLLRLSVKGLYVMAFSHDLLWEYLKECGPKEAQECIPLVADAFTALLATRAGSRSAALCAAYASAKNRKRMLKSLKGYVGQSLCHRDAYLCVMSLVECVDDTVTCQKMLLAELLENVPVSNAKLEGSAESWVPRGLAKASSSGKALAKGAEDDNEKEQPDYEKEGDESESESDGEMVSDSSEPMVTALFPVCMHMNGCKLLLRMLAPEDKRYFDPEELATLEPVMVPSEDDPSVLVPTSKKDPSARRRELLTFMQKPLEDMCIAHASQLMRSKFAGSKIVYEAMRCLRTSELVEAVAEAAAAGTDGRAEGPMYDDNAGHLCLKQMLKCERELQEEGTGKGPWLADKLMERIGGELLQWASSNRGAFVLSALIQVPSVSDAVALELSDGSAELRKLAESSKGAEELLKEMTKRSGTPKKGAKKLKGAKSAVKSAAKSAAKRKKSPKA